MSGSGAFGTSVFLAGVALFSCVLLFQIVILPVESDASARAKKLAVEHGIVLPGEREGMDRVLNAAALTYVARTGRAGLGPRVGPRLSPGLVSMADRVMDRRA